MLLRTKRKKADKYAGLQALVFNLLFILTVCGLCDIYRLYSMTVCVLQVVNMLPHVKFDRFEKECRRFCWK